MEKYYYSLSECTDLIGIEEIITDFKKQGIIEYKIDNDSNVLILKDIGMSDKETEMLDIAFSNSNVFEDRDYIDWEDMGEGKYYDDDFFNQDDITT